MMAANLVSLSRLKPREVPGRGLRHRRVFRLERERQELSHFPALDPTRYPELETSLAVRAVEVGAAAVIAIPFAVLAVAGEQDARIGKITLGAG